MVNKRGGSSLVPERKESPHRSGKSLFWNIHDEDEVAS